MVQALDDAVADGMQVVNMSLGSFPALRPGDDIQVRAVERAIAAGLIVVTAAGNDGPEPGTVGSPAQAPNAIAVGNSSNDRIFSSYVQLGSSPGLIAYPGNAPGMPPTVRGAVVDAFDVDPRGELCQQPQADALAGRIVLILRGSCSFEEKLVAAQAAGAAAAVVYSRPEDPDVVRMNVGRATLPAMSLSSADGLLLREQLRTDPGAEALLALTTSVLQVDPNRISSSSSRGPDVNAAVKPELLAVGSSVYTAAASQGSLTSWQVASGTSLATPFVSGVAGLLVAARPGLTPAQYRSLIVNSARELSQAADQPFALQAAGAGRLDAASAMRMTLTANPVTVSFGVGTSSTVNRDRAVTLTNLGTAADTVSLSVAAYGTGPVPTLSENSISLEPGASREIALHFSGGDLPAGQYSGLLIARSATSDAEARIPWWFGVPSETVASMTVIDPQESVQPSRPAVLYVRPTDASGFPVEQRPEVTVVSGGGRVTSVQAHLLYPGFYTIGLRMGPEAGDNTFDISAGGVTRRYVFTAE
jgi:subtilisin family serine protease